MSEPTAPKPADAPAPEEPTRRSAMLWVTGGVGAAAAAAVGIPVTGFLLGALRPRPKDVWVNLGDIADASRFPLNETRLHGFDNPEHEPWDGDSKKNGAYIRYLGKDDKGQHQFWVFSMICAHLGCPVTWFPQSGLFMCPCHGGVYYENGDRASGPPPRGLYKMPWRISDKGQLEVQAPHLPTLQDTLEKPSDLVQLGIIKRDRGDRA